jgi:hypothetical protein
MAMFHADQVLSQEMWKLFNSSNKAKMLWYNTDVNPVIYSNNKGVGNIHCVCVSSL